MNTNHKLVAAALTSSIMFANSITVLANPTAGYINKQYDIRYENPTQWIFQNNNIWKDENKETTEDNEQEDIEEDVQINAVWQLNDEEKTLLKKCVMAECGYNQPDEGVRLVVDVILNRVESSTFPDDVISVISQPNQFSSYWNGAISSVNEISEQVDRIVEEELQNGATYSSVMYFTAGRYNPYCTPWKRVGDHYFGF